MPYCFLKLNFNLVVLAIYLGLTFQKVLQEMEHNELGFKGKFLIGYEESSLSCL